MKISLTRRLLATAQTAGVVALDLEAVLPAALAVEPPANLPVAAEGGDVLGVKLKVETNFSPVKKLIFYVFAWLMAKRLSMAEILSEFPKRQRRMLATIKNVGCWGWEITVEPF